MLISILKWLRGYLIVAIKGYSPERFINLCSNRDILIWNMRQTNTGYEFYISLKAFRKLKPIVKKTKTMPRIKKRIGLPFLLYKYRKRKVFFGGIVVFFILLYTFSLFIWDITIEGQQAHTKELILKYLKSQEIYSGVLKKKVNCKAIEEALRLEYNDISWVSAEIKGTRMIIKITETNMPVIAEKLDAPCHIIAQKDGIITSIVTRKGKPLVQKGDIVKKGDILVSGVIEIIGDGELLMKKEACVSDADIKMKTFYNYKDKFSLKYNKKTYTLREKRGFEITILNKKIILYSPLKKYSKYDIIEQENTLKFGNNFYLPFKYTKSLYKEYEESNCIYTKEEAEAIAGKNLNLYIEKLKEKGTTILENNVNITVGKENCTSSGKLIVEESAINYKAVDDNEWRNLETDEHNGDDN